MFRMNLYLIVTVFIIVNAVETFSQVSNTYFYPSGIPFHNFRSVQKHNYSSTTYYYQMSQYVDFSATSAYPNKSYVTEDFPKSLGIKTHGFAFRAPETGCFEITTSKVPKEGYFEAATSNADTKMWLMVFNGTTQAWNDISDDYGGTYYSGARFWTTNSISIEVKFASYSASSNNIDFFYNVVRYKASSLSECQSQSPALNMVNMTTSPWTITKVNN